MCEPGMKIKALTTVSLTLPVLSECVVILVSESKQGAFVSSIVAKFQQPAATTSHIGLFFDIII